MESTFIEKDSAPIWDEYISNSPLSHIFQSFEWGEFKSNFGWEPIRIAFQENGKMKAALQILKRKIPLTGRSFFYIPRGPIWEHEDEEALASILNSIRRYSKEKRAVIVKISPDILDQNQRVKSSLEMSGFHPSQIQLQHRCTFRLDLNAELEEIYARMEARSRYAVRKEEKDGVEIQENSDISTFFNLYQQMGERKKIHQKTKDYFLKIKDLWFQKD